MVKIHTTISIDSDLKQKAQNVNLNLSEVLTQALEEKLKPQNPESNECDPIVEHEKVVRNYFQNNGSKTARPFALLYLHDMGYNFKEIRQLLVNWLPIKSYSFTVSSVQYELRLLLAQRKQKRLEKEGF